MVLTPRLEVRQSQNLTLTPQLMQSIKLLQLSHLELNAFVDAEVMHNPLLERGDGPEAEERDGEPFQQSLEGGIYDEDTVDHADRIQSADAIAQSFDTDVENVFPDQAAQDAPGERDHWTGRAAGAGNLDEAPDVDQFVAARPTLADHLWEQIGLLLNDPGERLIARFLVDGLNEAGYLSLELHALAEQLGAPVETVERVLAVLQTCDPVGVFARNVRECLTLQLKERDRFDPLMQRLLDNLELLAAHDMQGLSRAVGADREDLLDMLAEVRTLDPKPGRAFQQGPVEAVVPDAFVRRAPGGGWAVELNAEVLPRVLVDRAYYARVTRQARDAAEKAFLADCLQTANWLTRSLDQRAQTVLKVTTEIVRQQDAFLLNGITHLRPMTLKMVADAIEMHESTVSRVTSNKYVATPRGLFELKYFFTTALGSSTGGENHSAEAVRHRIRQLVEAEAPDAILSDDTIAELLHKEQGIEVARRTVAKYREGMNIPSSVIRRRQKRELAGVR
jgi:RNA polymerase sigma-54 factor